MREDDCRRLLCLQQNFAKMLKPRVQAVVTASCSLYVFCAVEVFLLETQETFRFGYSGQCR